MKLPQELSWDMADNRWAAMIEPVINQPINQGLMLTNIQLISGSNVLNHRLGRKLIGWFVTSKNGLADIYDTQATNQMQDLTLQLVSSTPVTVNLWVF